MKNSNSRDKNVKTVVSPPVNKLMKTDIQQPKREELERTNYNRPASGKKLQSTKVLPPKGPPSKKQYVIEDHMTESRITQAKQGLQLLKKKMSSKGLSREKVIPNQQIQAEKPITSLKTVGSSKAEETQYYENRNNNMPPKKIEKKPSQQEKPPSSSKTVGSFRNINQNRPTPQNERKQPPPPPPSYEQYRNEQMEIPIKPKKDFNALLEQELRKQQQGKSALISNKPTKSAFNKFDEYPDEANMELIKCRHCERMFGEAAIQKHEKICVKVFLSKRKAFDSAAYRAPEVEGIQQIQTQNKKVEPPKAKKQLPPKVVEEAAIPKWKAASLAFRANLKQAKGVTITAQQKQAADIAQGLVPCNYCGRKFNQKAAARHIAFCETKSKQIPRMNTTMKKK